MHIGRFNLDEKVLVVAEIGNNHEGDFEVAKAMVQRAAECGVDAVKFQTFRTEHYVGKSDLARFNRLKQFELSPSQFKLLSQTAHQLGLLFISTPFDLGSAEILEGIVDCYKIASGDNNFYPLLGRVAQTGKPIMVSTGASDFPQVARTVAFVKQRWSEQNINGELALLHCVSNYPVPPEQANLRAIQFLKEHFDGPVGYSDHTIGVEAALLAVALGARIIEKHFTLDKGFSDFRDHQLSADPAEMQDIVQKIRLVPRMLGQSEKTIQPCETALVAMIRRSIVAARDLPQGHRLIFSDLTWLRPAGGLPPGEERVLVGKNLKHPVALGDRILPADVE